MDKKTGWKIGIEETVYQTTTNQKHKIQLARTQISKGQGISSKDADIEIGKWLSE